MESGGISSDWTGLTHQKVSMGRVFEPNVPPIPFQKRRPRATRCDSSSLFDCLVPLMRGTKPPTQKSSEAALREGAAYQLQKLA